MGITKKQKQVFDYIKEYFASHGVSPTQNEIKDYFGFKSFGSVQKYIQYLTEAGFLKNSWNARRGLEPVDLEKESFEKFEIPLLGSVAAGSPIEAIQRQEMISIPPTMVKSTKDIFALNVQGQSMIDDGILDGDIIICKKQSTANNGDTVVALIDNEATVKRFYKKANSVELHPANSSMKPFIYKGGNLKIEGIVVGLLRVY
jgi:repressor LexA